MNDDLTYWVTLATMPPELPLQRRNAIYVGCFRQTPRVTVRQLFEDSHPLWRQLGLTDAEMQLFENARATLAKTAFMVEDLLNQGYTIVPFDSPRYPQRVKRLLKINSPTVLFVKGNPALLADTAPDGPQPPAVALADDPGARSNLDNRLAAGGRGIIVLSRGITTWPEGCTRYYKPLVNSRLTIVSAAPPMAPRSVGLIAAATALAASLEAEAVQP